MWNDFRFAFRTLRRSPGFTALAVISLALGIGANTAIFSLLYQVVLRSLPVRDPGSLVILQSNDYTPGWTRRDNDQTVFSYPMYEALRDRNQVFSGLLARAGFPATLSFRGEAVRASAEMVSGNFFEVLGVRPAVGRLLISADDKLGQNPVVVLGHAWWESHLGADPGVVNSRIFVNGQPAIVAGVAPRGFRGLLSGNDPDFYAPFSSIGLISPGWDKNHQPDAWWLSVLGRLKPGITAGRATVMLRPLFRAALEDELPRMQDVGPESRQKLLAKPIAAEPDAQGVNALRAQWQKPLLVLMVMVGLVLLIACANVANLLMARATAREREMAIRLAVGAGRGQLVRQLMTESLVLAAAGGLVGLVLSQGVAGGLLRQLPEGATGGWLNAQLDLRLMAFSLALSLATGILFGLAPAVQALRSSLAPALKNQTAGLSAGGSQSRIRQGLMVGQICLSLLLLIAAALFTRSLVNLVRSDPGFQAERLIAFTIDPSLSGYNPESRLALFRDLTQRLRTLPGVRSAALSALVPLGGWNWGNGFKAPGSRNAGRDYVYCNENSVGEGYFNTMGIPLVAGRDFNSGDRANSQKVAILNESFARFVFDTENPVGRHIRMGSNDADTEIVGIVKDAIYSNIRDRKPHVLYAPYEQGGEEFTRQGAFLIRTRGDERAVMRAVRAAVRQSAPNLPLDRLTSMKVVIDESIYRDRIMATLAAAFGFLAALLAAVGLYGTVSYSVARRTREFGIRLVLGAEPESLLLFVMREVGVLVAIGIGVGLPLTYLLARLAESQLFGIRAHDPLALAAGTLIIAAVGFVAGLVPALRAMRTQPLNALRYE
ncbi:MAG: ABC transporter permease [Bryobacteraceae bacterium]